MRNSILVLGRSASNPMGFVEDIIKLNAAASPPTTTTTTPAPAASLSAGTPRCVPWTLTTKYYTAALTFWIDTTDTPLSPAEANEWNVLGPSIDGFIFLYDKTKPETFKDLAAWTGFLASAEPSVILCVGIGGADAEPDQSHIDWCVERGVEYVDLDETQEEQDPSSSLGGADKYGLPRVLEALETNIWGSMVRTGSSGGGGGAGSGGGMASAGAGADDRGGGRNRSSWLNGPDSFSDGASTTTAFTTKAEKGGDSGDEDDLLGFDDFDLPTREEARRFKDSLFGDVGDDTFFERTVEQLKSLREGGSELGDEERRKLAAKIALSLTLDDDDDDDDDKDNEPGDKAQRGGDGGVRNAEKSRSDAHQ
ncbi:hypothetical protein DFJ73DRAFT_110784 [Zopfochytrium polystomum]|nr:hypothetical protein DFJ73DRAFT_110784 [Zopfochytrium polystomum]